MNETRKAFGEGFYWGGSTSAFQFEGGASEVGTPTDWATALAREARRRLEAGEPEVWKHLADRFEAELLRTALALTHGRRA